MYRFSITEARRRFNELVERVERGNSVIIMRRGRNVARMVPARTSRRMGLPDMSAFRATITVKGESLSKTVITQRAGARY